MVMPRGRWMVLGVLPAVLLVLAACTTEADDRFFACFYSQERVREELLAPRDAKFQDCDAASVVKRGSEWRVSSFVDAPNAFGARLRKDFTTTARKATDGSGDWLIRLDSLE